MAIVISIVRRGQKSVTTLNGAIRLEDGRNRMVVRNDDTNGKLNVIDGQGIKTFDSDVNEVARNGLQPDGSYNVAVVNPGESIEGAIT